MSRKTKETALASMKREVKKQQIKQEKASFINQYIILTGNNGDSLVEEILAHQTKQK